MGVRKEELYELIDKLHENKRQAAYDYLTELMQNPTKDELEAYWSVIDNYVEPDSEPPSEEAKKQIENPEYITWEQLKRDCQQT